MKLSILIPSLDSRSITLNNLRFALNRQIEAYAFTGQVEIITKSDSGELTIGAKRNALLEEAKGEYICFVDDDDEVSKNYIKLIMDGINSGSDCCSLTGVITWNGSYPEVFEHSIKYNSYTTNETALVKYERYPNHLNVIKSSIAKQFKFPEIDHGEDTDWATQIYRSGLIKNEFHIPTVLYHYKYVEK